MSGVERLAYRIQGNACSGAVIRGNITNEYDNNEAHSSLSGVNIWPMDKGFEYDTGKSLHESISIIQTTLGFLSFQIVF